MTAITKTPGGESGLSATVRRSKYLRLDEENPLYGYLYVIPFLIFFVAFTVFPIFRGLQVSFADWDVVNPPRFVGLENYKRLLLQDKLFITCLKNTVSYVVMYVPLGILVPMFLAELLFKPVSGRAFFRSSFALPIMVTVSSTALIWGWFLNPMFGLINLYFVGSFFNTFLPTSFGGDAIRMVELARHSKRAPEAVGTVLVDRANGLWVLFIVGLLALPFTAQYIPLQTVILFAAIYVAGVAGGWVAIK